MADVEVIKGRGSNLSRNGATSQADSRIDLKRAIPRLNEAVTGTVSFPMRSARRHAEATMSALRAMVPKLLS